MKKSMAEAQNSEGEENWVSYLTIDHQLDTSLRHGCI